MKERLEAIRDSVRAGAEYDPLAMWILAGTLLVVALILTWWYLREKFIIKRRFQYHKPLPGRHDRPRRP